MELQPREVDALEEYLGAIDCLIGDRRTRGTFRGAIKGIIASESLVCAKIAPSFRVNLKRDTPLDAPSRGQVGEVTRVTTRSPSGSPTSEKRPDRLHSDTP